MSTVPFKGIIPPLATPLADRDALDVEGLERLVAHVLDGGVHGLFILGTTGEGPSLSHALQHELVSRCVELADRRAPVLVGVTDTSMDESLALCRHAAEVGADAVVLAAPYYFPMHQADLVRYVREFAAASPLPVMLYNMPSHTKTAFSLDTVRQLLHDCAERRRHQGQCGTDAVLSATGATGCGAARLHCVDGTGGTAGRLRPDGRARRRLRGANLVPRLYVDLYEAALTGDLRQSHRLQQRVLRLSAKLYEVGPAPTGYLTGLKTSLELLGLCSGRLSEPLYQVDAGIRKRLEQHLRDLGLAVVDAGVR